MSDSSTSSAFDIWEVITCARCHLPFAPEPGVPPQVPFWLTDCGHIVCNSHLNADQTCVQCHAPNIELMPLQRDMEAPMSNWFCSLPNAIDSVAAAAQFQQEMLASLLRFYKQKCAERGALINRLKGEVAENKILKKDISALRLENDELRRHMSHPLAPSRDQPSESVNSNGKRPMTSIHRDFRGGRSSSPRSVFTPVAPSRLTLPTNQQPPGFSFRQETEDTQRQGSNEFVQQYAYVAPQTPSFRGQGLSHTQAGPLRQPQMHPKRQNQAMPPPVAPPLVRNGQGRRGSFKPAAESNQFEMESASNAVHVPGSSASLKPLSTRDRQQAMGPPPPPSTAQQQMQNQGFPQAGFTPAPNSRRFPPTPQTNRFVPSAANGPRFVPQAPSGAPQRFVPAAASSRKASANTGQGQRRSFNSWNPSEHR